ncbi:ABC transporter substrate-binding protein [Streptomyces orinoci]|uniref:ABC transporter substrate-binding protein n=1 Tax=Streptomyces orinoci TaxID=67339 RepID=A0ABV3JU89_STRON|nr:ABC transporter substrate-binding protein [Streptomyces orinoci]
MTASTTPRPAAARSRLAAVGAIAVAGALLLTGCGDQTKKHSDNGDSSATGSSAPLFDKLPQSIKDSKVIKVGSDIAYPPVEFIKDGKTVGMDPDIADALGQELGVKFQFNNSKFDALMAGLRSNRYDIAMSAMTDTKDRQNGVDPEKKTKVGDGVDFVDYFQAGVSMYVPKGKTQGIKSLDDLCGKKIVVQRGTTSEDMAKKQADKCGDKKLDIEAFDTDVLAQTRLRSGGADVGLSDFPVAAYAVKTSGGGNDFELVGDQVEAAPYGMAVPKNQSQLRDAIKAAMDRIIASHKYEQILDKWGVKAGAITESKINGGS